MKLTRVDVAVTVPGDITVVFAWTGDIENQASVLWSVFVHPSNGRAPLQLGYKLVDGQFAAFFVFDYETTRTRQINVPGAAVLTDGELMATFPVEAVGRDISSSWRWKAHLSVAGIDVDEREGAIN